MGRYEPHSELSLPGLSRKTIYASGSVCGSDPRDKESINISSGIGDSFFEKVFKEFCSRWGQMSYHFALPLRVNKFRQL